MNRRHFLKFIPLIPVAIGLVKIPKPAESVAEHFKPASLDTLLARQKALYEMMGRTRTIPAPANGSYYTQEEIDIIAPLTSRWIKEHLDQVRLNELLHQKIMETLAGDIPAIKI